MRHLCSAVTSPAMMGSALATRAFRIWKVSWFWIRKSLGDPAPNINVRGQGGGGGVEAWGVGGGVGGLIGPRKMCVRRRSEHGTCKCCQFLTTLGHHAACQGHAQKKCSSRLHGGWDDARRQEGSGQERGDATLQRGNKPARGCISSTCKQRSCSGVPTRLLAGRVLRDAIPRAPRQTRKPRPIPCDATSRRCIYMRATAPV